MSIPKYHNLGPVDCSIAPVLENIRGKSVIITGGASGLGKAYVEGFIKAGAYVTIGDFNEKTGSALAEQYPGKCHFIRVDVTSWDEQVAMFKSAIDKSPHKSCDVVIANAGISGPDTVYQLDSPFDEPIKPDLSILNINLIGVTYSAKLAFHYFRKQPLEEGRDRCFIIKSSVSGYIDQPGSPQYNMSKFGNRGLMRSFRRTSWQENIRINLVAPWFIRTPIISEKVQQHIVDKGGEYAEIEDAVSAMLKIASDRSINGRAIAVIPKSVAPEGYMDAQQDDFAEGSMLWDWQEKALHLSHRVAVPNKDQ